MQPLTRHNLFIYLLSAITIVFALYLFNPFNFYFLNDDLVHIPLSKAGELFQRRSFRPIGDLSVQMDYLLWGKKAWGYHLTNLVLHIANSILVFFLSNMLLQKYTNIYAAAPQSLMVAILFFVYAFHSESVFWILGRSGSLGTLFFIPAIIFYSKRHEKGTMFILSLVFFELGLLAYESVWIFPLVAILLSIADRRRYKTSIKKEATFIGIVLMMFCAHMVTRFNVIGEVTGTYEASGFMQFDVSKLAMNFIKLLGRCFIPPVDKSSTFIVNYSLFVVLTIAVAAVYKKQTHQNNERQLLLLVLILFIISLIPYLSLGIDTHGVEGERYLYMPSIFACILLVSIINTIVPGKSFQLLTWTLLLIYNLFFLSRSASYYKTAGNISKITFQQVNLLKGKQRLFIDSLPQSYNGALMFRLGFDEGVQWLKEDGTVGSVIILSLKKDDKGWSQNYNVQNLTTVPSGTFSEMLIRDITQQQTYTPIKISPTAFNPKTDAWFIFKDDGLQVIK